MRRTNRPWFIGFISACALAAPLLAEEDARAISAEERFAEALVETRIEEERAALLAKDAELITAALWKALIEQGDRVRLRGDYARALDVYTLAQIIAEKIGDKLGIAQALSGRGVVHLLQSNYALALEYQQKSLALSEEVGDKAMAADIVRHVANVYYSQGDYDLALENYRSALKQFEISGDKAKIAVALNNIGAVYQEQGNYALALQYLRKSLGLREEIGHKEGIASTLGNLGNTYFYQGNYDLALEYYQKSLSLNEKLGKKQEVAKQMYNIGGVCREQANYSLAVEYFQKSLAQQEALGDKLGIARTLNGIGNVNRLQNNWGLALEFCRKSLALYEAMGGKRGTAEALRNIGLIQLAQGDDSQALETSSRAAAIFGQLGVRETLWEALTVRGRAHRALGRQAEARQSFEEAIAIIEEMRAQVAGGEREKQQFFEGRTSPYYEMVGLLIAQNKPGEALIHAERAKARVLLDVIGSARADITKSMTAQEQELEQRLRSELISSNTQASRERARPQPDDTRISDLDARLQKARLAYEAFQTNLYAAHPELKGQRGEAQPMRNEELGALLPDAQSAVLEYVAGGDKTFLFVLTKGDGVTRDEAELKAYTLAIKGKELADRVEQFRRQLGKRELGFRTQARELYDLLLGPAREQLRGRTSLIVVPDAVLWELAFQALRSAENRYVLEDFQISYAPSLTVLREMKKVRRRKNNRPSTPPNLLAFGNPALEQATVERVRLGTENKKLTALPEAEQEVKTLGEMYGASHSNVYVGTDASEERVKAEAGRCNILHLATHGILNNAAPMYSQVVLSQATESANEDGLLEAWEIMKLELQADLVVLSGCETGRGRVGAGEGMIGLTWAFFVAGSPTTVVSQWKVESASTTQLMVEFHRQRRARRAGVGAAEALREAALTQMRRENYWHPFYWASFVVIGDGSGNGFVSDEAR